MKPENPFNKDNFRVESTDIEMCQDFIEKYHYLHSVNIGSNRYCFNVVKVDEKRSVGCIVFGNSGRPELSKSISPLIKDNEILELKRVWIEDGTGSGLESYAITQAFGLLPDETRVVVSYADPSAGHKGTIYQALNGIYQELPTKDGFRLSLDDGQTWKHSRNVARYFGGCSLEQLKRKICCNFWIKEDVHKYRYLWFFSRLRFPRERRQERQQFVDSLIYPPSPYPKTTREPTKARHVIVESK
jgi:hypothetical protein